MTISIDEFWKRAVANRILTADRCRQLNDEFIARPGAEPSADSLPLARWLVGSRVLTRAQASALLSPPTGKPLAPSAPNQASPGLKDRTRPPELPSANRPNSAAAAGSATAETDWPPPPSFSRGTRRTRRKLSPSMFASALVAFGLLAAIVGGGLLLPSQDRTGSSVAIPPDRQSDKDPRPSSPETEREGQVAPSIPPAPVTPPSLIDDDGKTLWVSPTTGPALRLDYAPPGTQVFVVMRLAEILDNPEGRRVVAALAPSSDRLLGELHAALGVELLEVEQLIVALYPDDAGMPHTAYVARLRTPISEAVPPRAWGAVEIKQYSSKSYLQGARWDYYLPAAGHGRVVAIASSAAMKEILEIDGAPPLRKEIERLLRNSDTARHFNLVAAPDYLWTDGKTLLAGGLERLREPLSRSFDQGIDGISLSAHLGTELYLELRAVGRIENEPAQLALQFASRLAQGVEEIERHLAAIDVHPYGRMVLNRFPRMLQLVSDYTRTGAEDRQAVLNCYLPLAAAHNLLLGAQLALGESSAESPAVADKPVLKAPASAAAALEKRISLSFPRDTLEHCLELLSKEIDIEVVILGSDLQLEGITKNQSFGLDLRDRPAKEILRAILKLANPDGKLVYVIRANEQGESIAITTRSAVAKRGETLPESLREQPEKR